MSNENLKLSAGASKPPIGIVPMHPLLGVARVLEDSSTKYAPFNYMAAQTIDEAVTSYDSAELRHRIESTMLGGEVTPASYAALDGDSGLPHIYHRIAGLLIVASLMIRDGVIKADPGPGKRKIAAGHPTPAAAEPPLSMYDEPDPDAARRAAAESNLRELEAQAAAAAKAKQERDDAMSGRVRSEGVRL